jgi:hypothetical protein
MNPTLTLKDVVHTGRELASSGQAMTIDLVRRAITFLPLASDEAIIEDDGPVLLDDEELEERCSSL